MTLFSGWLAALAWYSFSSLHRGESCFRNSGTELRTAPRARKSGLRTTHTTAHQAATPLRPPPLPPETGSGTSARCQREPELPTPQTPKAAPRNHRSGGSLGEQLVRPFFLQKRKLRTENGATCPGANGHLPFVLAVQQRNPFLSWVKS